MRFAIAFAVLAAAGSAQAAELTAARRSGEVVIDGRLDEPAWAAATPFDDFWQRAPLEGQPPTFPTEVRVLYDDTSIYVAVRASDREPHRLRRVLTRYDMARIDQTTVAATLRARVGITPELSVDLYAQPFVSRGGYGSYREVTAPDAADYADRFTAVAPGDFPEFAPADFRFRELRSNLVFRWEYRPGSAALLVWSHGRTSEVAMDDLGGDLDSLADEGDDVVLAKVSYWFTP